MSNETLNRLIYTAMDFKDSPKCVYRSSSNGFLYCMVDNTNRLEINVVDPHGDVVNRYEHIEDFYRMSEKIPAFFKQVDYHINHGRWIEE